VEGTHITRHNKILCANGLRDSLISDLATGKFRFDTSQKYRSPKPEVAFFCTILEIAL